MPKAKRKDVVAYAAIDPDIMRRLKADAERENRSVAKQIGNIIKKFYEARVSA